MRTFAVLLTVVMLCTGSLFGELPVGEKPVTVDLDGKLGSRVDGSPWSSSELKDKVYVLVYSDPDEADLNNAATEALKAENFPADKYGSVAVINMAATWLPNAAINIILKGKQEDYPSTIYVRDFKKALVKKWNLADDSNNILVFDKMGTVVFSRDGQLNDADIKTMIKAIRDNL